MTLNIHLSPFLAKQLYKNTLYTSTSVSTPSAVAHLGSFGKKILILVSENNFPVIADTDLAFLTRVLAPCGLSIADVAVVNISENADGKELLSHYKPEKLILFGVNQEMLDLPLRFPDFQVQPFDNCTYLSAPELSILQNDMAGKKELWESLRKLFSLK